MTDVQNRDDEPDSVGDSASSSILREEESRKGKELWSRAQCRVRGAVGMSINLKTLRDMVGDSYIPPEHLEKRRDLGEGAFATVELSSYCPGDGTCCAVAVKRLKPEIFDNERDLESFLNETRILRKVRHPSVVAFLGMGLSDLDQIKDSGAQGVVQEKVYLVQEFMGEGTLKDIIMKQMGSVRRRYFTSAQALEWMLAVARGLDYLHSAKPKVVHRDLKLENIMLKRDEDNAAKVVAKLGDFGLHTLLDANPKHVSTEQDLEVSQRVQKKLSKRKLRSQKTLKNAAYDLSGRTGSLMYMAPEVLREEKYNESCDIFSLGVIMYETFQRTIMLVLVSRTGDPSEVEEYAQSVANGARPVIPDNWPPKLAELVRSCWHWDPTKRPSAQEVVKELEAIKAADNFIWGDDNASCGCCSLQ